MPRENSVAGFQVALARYQQQHLLDSTVKYVDSHMLGQAYEQYLLLIAARTRAIETPMRTKVPGPFQQCPACHKQCTGVAYDCCFKAKKFKGVGAGSEQSLASEPTSIFCVPREQVSMHVDRETDGGEKSDCTTQYAADNNRAKRSDRYDIQAIGAVVCRHYIVHAAVPLRHGERYGYFVAILEHMLAEAEKHQIAIDEPFTAFYDVACRFQLFVQHHGSNDTMRNVIQYVTGKLHGATHTLKCQLLTNCLYRKGAGNCPGEMNEIVWAHTMKGATVAKYMTLLNFMRFFERHLKRWNQRQLEGLPKQLLHSAQQTATRKTAAEADLPRAFQALYGDPRDTPLTDQYNAAMDELKGLVSDPAPTEGISKRDIEYVLLLNKYAEEKQTVFFPHSSFIHSLLTFFRYISYFLGAFLCVDMCAFLRLHSFLLSL